MDQETTVNQSSTNGSFIQKPSPTQIVIKISELFNPQDYQTSCKTILILDNEINNHLFETIQPKCENIILVDGGSNRFHESKYRDSKKIRCIIGDLDGIKEETKIFFKQRGVDIIHDPDQNTTDFEKALQYCDKQGYDDLVFFNCYPGRIDHVLASMSNTQKYLSSRKEKHIILIGKNSLMIYLHPKIDYSIHVRSQRIQKTGCGLITFGKVEHIELKGFKWNMGEDEYYKSLEWAKLLSTSNQFVEDRVRISSSDPVFFIAQIKPDQKVELTW